jgi:hypothetical protein
VSGQRDVHAVAELAVLLGLGQVTAQPRGEAVELGVLQLAQRRVAQRPAPEADLDLRLEVALGVQRQRLEHYDPQRGQPGQPGRPGFHPGHHPAVGHQQRRAEDVGLVVEVVRQDAAGAAGLAGDGPDGGAGDAVTRDHAPGGGQDLVPPGVPVDDLRHDHTLHTTAPQKTAGT